eukprot:3015509-Ditylum_brightwellii.AAC.1
MARMHLLSQRGLRTGWVSMFGRSRALYDGHGMRHAGVTSVLASSVISSISAIGFFHITIPLLVILAMYNELSIRSRVCKVELRKTILLVNQ